MSTASVDTDYVFITPGNNHNGIYHTDPQCRSFDKTWRDPIPVPTRRVSSRRCCKYCSGEFEPATGHWAEAECSACSHSLEDGECPWCEQFDAIHDVPKDAEYCPVEVAAE